MWLFWVKGQGFRPWDACQKMLVYFDFDENEIVKVDSKTNFPAKSYSVFSNPIRWFKWIECQVVIRLMFQCRL